MGKSFARAAEKALRIEPPSASGADFHRRGTVLSVVDSAYVVRIGDADEGTSCSKYCDADVGDTVLVLVMGNGQRAAIAKLEK